jgi:hypothetical protein
VAAKGLARHRSNRSGMRAKLVAVLLVVVGVVGLDAAVRAAERSHDRSVCRDYTEGLVLGSNGRGLPLSRQPASYREALDRCIGIRGSHRAGPFGLSGVTVTGQAAASCDRAWTRLGSLSATNPAAADSWGEGYGIHGRLDPTSPADRQRYLDACIPSRARELNQHQD